MPLFDATVSAPTTEQRKAAASAAIKRDVLIYAKTMLSSLDRMHRECLALVWANPDLTPQEAVAALGTDALTIFQGSGATTDFLTAQYAAAGEAYAPPALPEGATVTPNQDGTVTVVLPEPPPEIPEP